MQRASTTVMDYYGNAYTFIHRERPHWATLSTHSTETDNEISL